MDIRKVFDDRKQNWTTSSCKHLLGIDEEQAVQLLKALGYELSGNIWKLGQSKKANRLREKWIEIEKKGK